MAADFPKPDALPVQLELPDPLTMQSGAKVTTREQWAQQRAPELKALFQHYEYGFAPAAARVEAKLEREDAAALGGKAHLKEVALSWGMPGVTAHLLLVVPNSAKPAPIFLGLNFSGNHEVLADAKIRLPDVWMRSKNANGPHVASEKDRGLQEKTWNVEMAIERGYGIATFYYGDVVPDDAALAAERLKLFRPAERVEQPAGDGCAAVAAWAYALSRAADYLVTEPLVDGKRIAVVGHSRLGKTAMLAGALDERFKVIIPAQAGCSGTAPARVSKELSTPNEKGRAIVETVSRINTSFPHWFCGNYQAFNDEPARLPFDQHELIALCAPRAVLVSAATEDLWANPAGQYEMLKAADPVYRLVAGDSLDVSHPPEPMKLIPSRLGYFLRIGKHEMNTQDWAAWLDYADKWLK